MNLYAIQLPDGSIAMTGPYVLATENEAQANRMAHARDGDVLTFDTLANTAAPGKGDGRCMHGVRLPHECKDCQDAVTDGETNQSLRADCYDMIAEILENNGMAGSNIVESVEDLVDRLKKAEALAAQPAPVDDDWHLLGYAYASKQATECAQCGEHKHTPLRVDDMDGYVCLACIDKKLGELLEAQPAPVVGGLALLRNFEVTRPNATKYETDLEGARMAAARKHWRVRADVHALLAARPAVEGDVVSIPVEATEVVSTDAADSGSYMCPNCNTPWKCNGPHIAEPAAVEGAQGASGGEELFLSVAAKIPHGPGEFDPNATETIHKAQCRCGDWVQIAVPTPPPATGSGGDAVTELEITQARGDAWRDKYDADTDVINGLKAEVVALQSRLDAVVVRVDELAAIAIYVDDEATQGEIDIIVERIRAAIGCASTGEGG